MTDLVVTADDLGIDPRRDEGIFAAFAEGAITHASLLVGGPSASSAAATARRVGLPLGLHLDLTEMPPSARGVTTLVDGAGRKLGKHGFRAAVARGAIDLLDVERETIAQLAEFEHLAGVRARHVDGHQHAHVVPAIAERLASIFERVGVRSVRIPHQRGMTFDDPEQGSFYRAVTIDAAHARTIYARHGVRSTEAFVGLDTSGFACSESRLRHAVSACGGVASIELMVHPGFVGRGVDAFNESPAREVELRVLCRRPLSTLDVRLATFDDVALA